MDSSSIILRLPRFFVLFLLIDNRRIEDHRRGGHSLTHRRGINDRLEVGPGLTFGLHGTIVLTSSKIITPNHCPNGTLAWLQCDQPPFDDRSLFKLDL